MNQTVSVLPVGSYRINSWSLSGTATARARIDEDLISRTSHPVYRQLSLPDKFRILVENWKRDSQYVSSTQEMANLKTYRQIIDIGREVLPLLLMELQRDPDYWFVALQELSGANPVRPDQLGRLNQMSNAWLQWGRDQNLI